MKYSYPQIINLLFILFFSFKGVSQSTEEYSSNMKTLNAGGGDATSSSGSIAYSIGQVFYTYIGESVYNVAQGIQHKESEENDDNTVVSDTEIILYPNPTTDFVTIKMSGFDFENKEGSYQLYDIQGRLIKQSEITQTTTESDLSYLSSSTYILRVLFDGEIQETFKVLKK